MQCRLCAGKHLKFKYKMKGSTLYKCCKCGFVQVAEKPSEEESALIYPGTYFCSSKYRDEATQQKENKRRLAFIRSYLPGENLRSLKLLDFGCAAGDFITAADSTYDMWGHDLSEYAVEKARQNNPHLRERFSSGSPDKLQYPPAFFDGILMWDVIEHLWDPGAVCGQLLKYLKPGGSLFISTPNIGAITAKATGKYWAFMTPPEHLGFFSKQSITYLLEKRMACRVQAHRSLGKWANTGFILYKLKRIFPRLVPGFLPRFFQLKYTRSLGLYVPTGDIQYVAARKLPQGGAPGLI